MKTTIFRFGKFCLMLAVGDMLKQNCFRYHRFPPPPPPPPQNQPILEYFDIQYRNPHSQTDLPTKQHREILLANPHYGC